MKLNKGLFLFREMSTDCDRRPSMNGGLLVVYFSIPDVCYFVDPKKTCYGACFNE